MKFDLAVVGHIVLDYVTRKNRVYGPRLGGPCIYASLAANAVGAKAIAFSKVGSDFGSKRFSWIRHHGISTSHILVDGSNTTCFRIKYHDNARSIRVSSICDSICSEDFPRLPSALAIHIGPVLNEISSDLAVRLAESDSVVSLDPQGYLRQLDSNGIVHGRKWRNSRILKNIEVLKASENELSAIVGKRGALRRLSALGPEVVLLTQGSMGTLVWSKGTGRRFNVPAYETRVRDPTGAGDALAGAFLVTWVRTGDLVRSASVGAAVASFVVEKTKSADFGTLKQIERRATKIFDQTTRL
jgi:sugar/nucleoside kinase (ribokinase family)